MFALFLTLFPIMIPQTAAQSLDDYSNEIIAWRQEQNARLTAPNGWLALIGHHWLHAGKNVISVEDHSDVQLPSFVGQHCRANIIVEQSAVRLEADLNSGILVNEKPAQKIDLKIDQTRTESDSPDVISIGERIRLQLVRRNQKLAIRIRDSQSTAIAKFQGKVWFPVDPLWRVEAHYKAYDPPRTINIVNIQGDLVPSEIIGQLSFEVNGKHLRLDALQENKDTLFVLFKDLTNGKSTYGPGRFLDLPFPKGDRVMVDFNKAYNPPCALNPNTMCPLPPKQNYLDIEIWAGEKSYETIEGK